MGADTFFDVPFVALAHRGGASYAPNQGRENTLHAFGEAVALGYTHIETDVHASRDGALLAFHDSRLDRVTDGTGLVAELPLVEIARARISGQDPIPTLDEVLDAFPETRVNVDIKASPAIEPLAATIDAHRAHTRVNVASFSSARLQRFRRLTGGQVSTSVGPVGTGYTRMLPVLARRMPPVGRAFQVPRWTTLPGGRRLEVVTPAFIEAAHAGGRFVHVWTIDERAEMHELIDLGVDGLVSDRIDVLKDVLLERGLWHGRA